MIYTVTLNPSVDRTLHFERIELGQVNRATAVLTHLSGKGVNVSVALRALGVASVVLGFAGGDTGRALTDGLQRQGYDCGFVPVEGETRSNVTVIEDASGVNTKLNEAGPVVTEDDLATLERLLAKRASPGDWCVLSGSLPPGAPNDSYARLIGRLRSRGVRTALDSSGKALEQGCRACPDLIAPNRAELEQLLGGPFELEAQALRKAARALGPQRTLLTLGAQGALWLDEDGAWRGTPPALRQVSNVGAGDAALAGALYGLQAGLPPEACLRWAVAMGSAKIGVDGTGMPELGAVQALYGRITIEQIACNSIKQG